MKNCYYPGNAGTATLGQNVSISADDFESLKTLVLENDISMVVGPEDPLVKGIYDFFKDDDSLKEVTVIGPSKKGAQLEGSKEFAKNSYDTMFLQRLIKFTKTLLIKDVL